MGKSKKKRKTGTPEINNRRARHDYHILDTLECGIVLVGTEVKAIRDGNASIAEGYVSVRGEPEELSLWNVTIGEYPPAGQLQHKLGRSRKLLAHRREIKRLARQVDQKGVTVVPLKLYFKDGWAKLLIGLAEGKQQHDKRQAIKERDTKRELQRMMSVRR
ncbi:MAG: SsrA-binding protein SmpB [Planctomycetota bacterium]